MSGTAIHLVSHARPAPLDELVRADVASGMEPVVVLIHDAVLDPVRLEGVRTLALADDCRRRGLAVPDGALGYEELVDLMAAAGRVVSW